MPGKGSSTKLSMLVDHSEAPLVTSKALTVPSGVTVTTLPSATTGVGNSTRSDPEPPIDTDQALASAASNCGCPPAWPGFNPTDLAFGTATTGGNSAPCAAASVSACCTVTAGNTDTRSPLRMASFGLHAAIANITSAIAGTGVIFVSARFMLFAIPHLQLRGCFVSDRSPRHTPW